MKQTDKNLKTVQQITSSLYKGIGQEVLYRKQKDNKAFEVFLIHLYKRYGQTVVGEQFLWDFLTYNMLSLFGRKTMFGSMVMVNWLLSQKSIERWDTRNTEFSDYFISKFLTDRRIKRPSTFEKVDLEDIEDIERSRFFNTEAGYFNCASFTSYNEYSEYCKKCDFKGKCLKRNQK